jgi:transcriptional regulator with XRE-family HTH domain
MQTEKTAKRLRRLRELAGVSQAALAYHLGFGGAYLSLIESGYRPISQENMAKAEAFLQQEYDKRDREFASCLEMAIA